VYLQFGANHLGHFLLTALLHSRLERATDPRVVTIGSGFGRRGKLDLTNLDASRGYSQGGAYAQSKLANALFAAELDRRLRASGSKVKSVVAHPGVAATPLQQKPTGAMGVLSRTISALFGRPADNGALPTVQAAIGLEVQSGEVYGPGRGKTAPPRREERWPSFDDLEAARALWERSEELTRVKWLSDLVAGGSPSSIAAGSSAIPASSP
jgi:NAD(P)-dependent dehydrogenase (short-subunit alcohol dehydrogenase family)